MFYNRLKSQYGRSLVILMGGTFVAQLIPIIFYPIVSRIFSPSDFGTLSVFTQIASILSIIAPGGYLYAIFICKKKKEAFNTFSLSIMLSFIFLLFIFLCSIPFKERIATILNEVLLEEFLYFPFLSALFVIVYQCYNEWCVRNKSFKQLSFNKCVNSGAMSISETLIGCINPSLFANGLLFGELLGRGISATSCLFSIFKNDFYLLKFFQWQEVKCIMKKYSNFPKYIMPGKLINTVACGLPVFYLSNAFTKDEVGFFSMASMVLVIPISVVSVAVSDAFRQKANEDFIKFGSCRSILIKTIVPLSIISLVGFTLLFLIAPELFRLVLGDKWIMAGVYSRYLMLMMAVSFISEIAKPILIIAGKQHYDLLWQILFLCSIIIVIAISRLSDNIYTFLLLYSVVKSALFMMQLLWCYKFSSSNNEGNNG